MAPTGERDNLADAAGVRSQTRCFVFDSSSLIQMEHENGGKGLRGMPFPPGKKVVIPSRVLKEINTNKAPPETKRWLSQGHSAEFATTAESQEYARLRVTEPLLADADIQGIVLAWHRGCAYVVEEGRARGVASSMGVQCINIDEYLDFVRPRLL